MANRVGFYGAPCYDLMHYVARTLYHMQNGSILMLDLSANQSLTCSVPYPEGFTEDEIDYRGVTHATQVREEMLLDYDIILVYFGYEKRNITVDYAFLVTDCELHVIAELQDHMDSIAFTGKKNLDGSSSSEYYQPGEKNLIVLGSGASERERFVAQQLGIPLENSVAIDMDDANMECRLFCQYDVVFKFQRISSVYKEVIEKICMTITGGLISEKEYKRAFKEAERGK